MAPNIGTETRKPLFPNCRYSAFESANEACRLCGTAMMALAVDLVIIVIFWKVIGNGYLYDGCGPFDALQDAEFGYVIVHLETGRTGYNRL